MEIHGNLVNDHVLKLDLTFDGPVYDENQVASLDDENLNLVFRTQYKPFIPNKIKLLSKSPTAISIEALFREPLVIPFFFFVLFLF